MLQPFNINLIQNKSLNHDLILYHRFGLEKYLNHRSTFHEIIGSTYHTNTVVLVKAIRNW